jgi:hypothetical protein
MAMKQGAEVLMEAGGFVTPDGPVNVGAAISCTPIAALGQLLCSAVPCCYTTSPAVSTR